MSVKPTSFGLPREVQFCTRCVISNQRPSSVVEFKHNKSQAKPTIDFDEHGVCSACRYADIKANEIDWDARERELRELCDRHRREDGAYDCIIPGSGGKDSSYVSHMLKNQYGMHPLTVTWAPHQYTEIGWNNFQEWIRSGFDNILVTPNGRVHRLLTRLAFENLCHPFQPFIIGQRIIAPRFSALYNIPLIFYGESGAEYGNNMSEAFQPMMYPSFYEEASDLDRLYLGGVSAKALLKDHGLHLNDLQPYLPLDGVTLKKTGTQVHYMSYYKKWDPQENYYYATEHMRFQANTERTEGTYSKYSSIDDRIDPFHYYTSLIKFGIGRATYDASQEIRTDKITRDEGVALVHRYDTEFPAKYFPDFLEYTGISERRFWGIIDSFRPDHLWRKDNGTWSLRHQVE